MIDQEISLCVRDHYSHCRREAQVRSTRCDLSKKRIPSGKTEEQSSEILALVPGSLLIPDQDHWVVHGQKGWILSCQGWLKELGTLLDEPYILVDYHISQVVRIFLLIPASIPTITPSSTPSTTPRLHL